MIIAGHAVEYRVDPLNAMYVYSIATRDNCRRFEVWWVVERTSAGPREARGPWFEHRVEYQETWTNVLMLGEGQDES
jgi:hypothetical protein